MRLFIWPNDMEPAEDPDAVSEGVGIAGLAVATGTSRGALPTTIDFSDADGPLAGSASPATIRSRTGFGVGAVTVRTTGIESVITTLTGVGVGSGREVWPCAARATVRVNDDAHRSFLIISVNFLEFYY
jgi:hypothetical protein